MTFQPNVTHQPDLSHPLHNITAKIYELAKYYGRAPNSVKLLVVSKTRSVEDIQAISQHGQRDFGENYVQEALTKIEALRTSSINWHFIGALQSNKIKYVAQHFSWLHSLQQEKVAKKLNDLRAEHLTPLNVCLQVNITNEPSKSGLNHSEVALLAHIVAKLPKLKLRGLMALPKPSHTIIEQRRPFAKMRHLLTTLQTDFPQMDTLSMGTTNDIKAAIAEGATWVRIGKGVFDADNSN